MTAKATGRQREVIPGLESVLTPAFPPSVAFDGIGVAHVLTVTGATTVQARDYDDNSLKFWPSGDPMMLLVILGTDETGDRSLFIRGKALNGAFRKALTQAGVDGIAVGDIITVTWTGEEQVLDKKGKALGTDRKLYDVEMTV